MVEPSTRWRLSRRGARIRTPLTDGRAGYGGHGKAYRKQVRRDFQAVYYGACTPAERLALMLRHAAYEPSNDEREAATAFLSRPEHSGAMNVYTLLVTMENDCSLVRLASAVRKGFTLKRHDIDDWRLVYVLLGCCDTVAAAEIGITELALSKVVERATTGRGIRQNTSVAASLRAAADVRAVPLESVFGNLSDAVAVKNAWRRAAVRAGLRLGGAVDGADRTASVLREWPGTDWLMSVGLPVGALADAGT